MERVAGHLKEAVSGRGHPHSMVRVRHAGAEVSMAFWAKLAGIVGSSVLPRIWSVNHRTIAYC